jgi:hypothetical protein|nr:MAG TPA: hypothetical protein [Caudoviricetes sp.]
MSNFILKTLETRELKLNTIRLRGFYGGKLRKGSGGGGSGDGFPQLPGDVTRWYFGGLTNEMMAAMDDPRIEDADHKGRFLSFKNFAWSGMSGVGGYKYNFLSNDWLVDGNQSSVALSHKIVIINKGTSIQFAKLIRNELENTINITLKITGLEANGSSFKIYDNVGSSHAQRYNKDGIYQINYTATEGANRIYFYMPGGNMGQLENPITIEQLPLYPGALVFDGVDDYGTCDNFPILTKEKGYTVVALRQWISMGEGISGLVSNVKNWFNDGAFVLEYNSNNATNKFVNRPVSFGNVNIEMDLPNNFTYQTSKSYKGVPITTGSFKGVNSLFVGKLNNIVGNYSNVAIWELVFLDHDATEEELTKIKDYFVKTYPWLFPDQAWTVTGKTNEDEDRATIANITGNGNNLVLSNFGFAEGSGYGLYKLNFNNWFANSGSGNVNIVNVVNPHKIVLEQSQEAVGAFFLGKNVSYSGELKISVSNKPSDIELSFGSTALGKVILNEGINIVKINPVNTSIGFFTNKAFEAQNIIIEQIPEYEGYLVTDGVDDKAVSKQFKFGENFTVILDFKFPVKKISYCGFDLSSKVRIQNLQGSGVYVVLKGNKTLIPSNVVRAVTSEGKVYDENWNEYNIVPGNISSNYTMVNLGFDGSNQFAESATKLAGIYSSTLSKDDCIKAYNYLQTLKAK